MNLQIAFAHNTRAVTIAVAHLFKRPSRVGLRPSLHATRVYRKENEKGEQFRISTRIFRDRNWSRQTTFQTEHGGLTFVL